MVFFSGSAKSNVTRCWIKAEHIKPFSPLTIDEFTAPRKPNEKDKYDLAIKLATTAFRTGHVQKRIDRFSFVAQFDGIFGNIPQKNHIKKSKRHWSKLRKGRHHKDEHQNLQRDLAENGESIEASKVRQQAISKKILANQTTNWDTTISDKIVPNGWDKKEDQLSQFNDNKEESIYLLETDKNNQSNLGLLDNDSDTKMNSLPVISYSVSWINAMEVGDAIVPSIGDSSEPLMPVKANRSVVVYGKSAEQNTLLLPTNQPELNDLDTMSEKGEFIEQVLGSLVNPDRTEFKELSESYDRNVPVLGTPNNVVSKKHVRECGIFQTEKINKFNSSSNIFTSADQQIVTKPRVYTRNESVYACCTNGTETAPPATK